MVARPTNTSMHEVPKLALRLAGVSVVVAFAGLLATGASAVTPGATHACGEVVIAPAEKTVHYSLQNLRTSGTNCAVAKNLVYADAYVAHHVGLWGPVRVSWAGYKFDFVCAQAVKRTPATACRGTVTSGQGRKRTVTRATVTWSRSTMF